MRHSGGTCFHAGMCESHVELLANQDTCRQERTKRKTKTKNKTLIKEPQVRHHRCRNKTELDVILSVREKGGTGAERYGRIPMSRDDSPQLECFF